MAIRTAPQTHITKCARQGDVLLVRVNGPEPAGATELPRDNGRVVLAYGEVTGHAHAILDPGVCLLRAEGVAFDMLRVSEGVLARLVHEEHATVPLPKGVYRVVQQREYSPEAIRNVAD